MSGKESGDLIRLFCEGGDERFDGVPCKHYIRSDRECQLLRGRDLSEFLKKCRADTLEILYKATNRYLRKFRAKYKGLSIDKCEDIDFTKMISRLKAQRLTQGHNLIVWRSYVNIMAYREVRDILARKGRMVKSRQCGTCRHLPESKPYICSKNGETKKKTDLPCEEYSPDIVTPRSISDDISVSETPETLLVQKEAAEDHKEISFSNMIRIVEERIEEAEQGSKKREMFERQHAGFAMFLDLLAKGFSKTEAVTQIAGKDENNRKKFNRDMAEIRKFLKQKMS